MLTYANWNMLATWSGKHDYRPEERGGSPGEKGARFRMTYASVFGDVLNLASRDLADHDGVADHVGGALLALGPLGIVFLLFLCGPVFSFRRKFVEIGLISIRLVL
jgi:hypothetical protein